MGLLRRVLTATGVTKPPRDVLVTGLPRSGTTLTCHLLSKLPDTVALHEPMEFRRYTDGRSRDEVMGDVARFLKKQRRSIEERGRAFSKHHGGKVPDNTVGAVRDAAGRRTNEGMDRGEIDVEKPVPPGFLLVVKHNSAFTALLDSLVARFDTFAVMRNPLAVAASWSSVSFEVGNGHAPAAERIDADLASRLAAIPDAANRQVHLLGWFFARYRDLLPRERVIRYEDLVATRGKALAVVNPLAASLDEPLESRNKNRLYDGENVRDLGRRLLASDGAYWDFYTRESVEDLLR